MLATLSRLLRRPGVAIDLGTATTRIAAVDGELAEGPSLIRHVQQCRPQDGSDEYISYINNRIVSAPLRGGVIIDLRNAANLLKPLLAQVVGPRRAPLALACAPTDSSDNERNFLAEAILRAGAHKVVIIPEVWAAAVGAGIEVAAEGAHLLIDIGEGVSDMAVIRGRRVVFATAVRTACADLQKAVRNVAISRHKVSLYPLEAQRLTYELARKVEIATDQPDQSEIGAQRVAHDAASGAQLPVSAPESAPSPLSAGSADRLPRKVKASGMGIINSRESTVEFSSRELVAAMEPVLARILLMIEVGLRRLSPELAGEVAVGGICLSGGGALINGLPQLIAQRTGLVVRVAPDPLHSVINGALASLPQWRRSNPAWQSVVWPNIPS